MAMRHTVLLLMLSLLALLPGCAQQTLVAEVLQQPLSGHVYTRYNLFYENPSALNVLNPQTGRILPVGTEIEPIYADENKLVFRDAASKTEYTILFSDTKRMCTMREFIRQVLTLEPREKQLEGVDPAVIERILRGEVVRGMTRAEVLLAYGPPPPIRTPDQKMTTWTYYITPNETLRLVFRGDRVNEIFPVHKN